MGCPQADSQNGKDLSPGVDKSVERRNGRCCGTLLEADCCRSFSSRPPYWWWGAAPSPRLPYPTRRRRDLQHIVTKLLSFAPSGHPHPGRLRRSRIATVSKPRPQRIAPSGLLPSVEPVETTGAPGCRLSRSNEPNSFGTSLRLFTRRERGARGTSLTLVSARRAFMRSQRPRAPLRLLCT